MKLSPGIKVFAPATIGNVGVGFDAMGLALEHPGDEVIARFSNTPGLRIVAISGANGKLPFEVEKNTAGYAAFKLLEHLGETGRGIELEVHKKMPFSSGLGSSAASAVAGAMAVNELLGRPLEKRALLPFALQGEQLVSGGMFADNVAPALLGGLLLIRDHETLDIHRLPVPRGIYVTLVYPKVEVQTKHARQILSDTVPLRSFVRQSANLAGFVIGMYQSDIALIGRSLQDLVIEPQRAALIPYFYEVKEKALTAGALGCSISGSGPTIFAMSANSLTAERVGEAMAAIYADAKMEYQIFISPVNQEGAVLL